MYHLNDMIAFVENKITAHLNRSRTTDFKYSVVVECLEMFDSVNDITLVSVSLGVYSGVYNDKRGRSYGTSFIKCT